MSDFTIRIVTGGISGGLFLGGYFLHKNFFSGVLLAIFILIIAFEWPQLCKRNKFLWLLIPVYPFFPLFSLFYLNHFYRSLHILFPLYSFFVSWVSDTTGYVFGNLWGNHKLCPAISPKKSWEGLLGSFLGVLLFVLLFTRSMIVNIPVVLVGSLPYLVGIAGLLTLAALFGDLFESYLKRRAGIKDTGAILPGHGGLLDRFDSVFFVGSVVFLMVV